MNKPRNGSHKPSAQPKRSDDVWRPSMAYLGVALVLAVGAVVYLVHAAWPASDMADAAAPATAASATAVASAWPIQSTVPVSDTGASAPRPSPALPTPAQSGDGLQDPTPDLSNYVARGEKPTMNQVIDRLHQAGIHTGLGAFNPPGTRPPLIGLAVPEGFVLPEGYVRHYQATDDGQRIEPILMFAPDRQILDANNRPIEVPKDRVVPPELAPPGMPIRRIVVPAPADSERPGL